MIKTINTGVAELMLIKAPDGYLAYTMKQDRFKNVELVFDCIDKEKTYRFTSDFKWEDIGIAHNLSEYVWATIVENVGSWMNLYRNYEQEEPYFDTATESGKSLMEANQIYFENPYGLHEIECGNTCSCVSGCYQAQNWYNAQKNTGKWVVLKKTNV